MSVNMSVNGINTDTYPQDIGSIWRYKIALPSIKIVPLFLDTPIKKERGLLN
jgi:hypothetical protein